MKSQVFQDSLNFKQRDIDKQKTEKRKKFFLKGKY